MTSESSNAVPFLVSLLNAWIILSFSLVKELPRPRLREVFKERCESYVLCDASWSRKVVDEHSEPRSQPEREPASEDASVRGVPPGFHNGGTGVLPVPVLQLRMLRAEVRGLWI